MQADGEAGQRAIYRSQRNTASPPSLHVLRNLAGGSTFDPPAFLRTADTSTPGVPVANISGRPREWVNQVINLLDAAVRQLRADEQAAHVAILEATSVLRRQVAPGGIQEQSAGRGRLLAWQIRKVREFIDARISGPIWVSDLCALVRLSEAHFSRVFKRTLGESPHAFVVRRRVELASQCMLRTDVSLSDIAQRFGFTDQAHLCKHFRLALGQPPAAWRRAQRSHQDSEGQSQDARRTALAVNRSRGADTQVESNR
jgi:AraC family transcriptional regulator